MTDTPHFEDNLDPFEGEPLPLRSWEQAALKELVTIVQGLCSCGYPQPGDVVFALRDVAACLEEQYIGTQGRAMAREILSALTGHEYPPPGRSLRALPPAAPCDEDEDEDPIIQSDDKTIYLEDLETLEDDHEHS